ncbi:MAG: ABC transporter substrate-binding protein [Acidimicrobiales bacterium]
MSGGTLSVAMDNDPGNLNPLTSVTPAGQMLDTLAYDQLVLQAASGTIEPELATKWSATSTVATFTIRRGVTCSDGSALTPEVIAKNYDWVLNAKNASPFLGVYINRGSTVTADNSTNTVRIVSPSPSSFLIRNLSSLMIVCQGGLTDIGSLSNKTVGSGPYVLTSSTPGQTYDLSLRKGYNWGPGGVTSSTPGLPAHIAMKVVASQSTAANLLLSGGLNIAEISGPDRARLGNHGLFEDTVLNNPEFLLYNQKSGRPTSSELVRKALTMALDVSSIGKVSTSDNGIAINNLEAGPPSVCHSSSSLTTLLPKRNASEAGNLLTQAGWVLNSQGVREKAGQPLTVHFIYSSSQGAPIASAVQLIQQEWSALGVKVVLQAASDTQVVNILFSGGNWDVSFVPVVVTLPASWTGIFEGPTPPNGGNIAFLDNKNFNSLTTAAENEAGSASCPDWESAEHALITDSDIVPIAGLTQTIYGRDVRFSYSNTQIVTSSLRMLKSS